MTLRESSSKEFPRIAKIKNPASRDRRERSEEILTSREARQLLKIGRTKLWELTHQQLIPAYRVGDGKRSSLRYKRSELLAWLDQNRV